MTLEIARLRHATPGVTLISPPPHHDIYSIEDLAQLIYDLKQINPDARVCVKLVSEAGIGTIAAGVAKAKADVILVSGHVGGTGASPQTSIKYAGTPWEMGLSEVNQLLTLNRLRHRVTLRTDGGLKTGRDIVIAALLGAEEYGIGTLSLVAMGCIMVRQCHSNTCPVGVCTQRPDLREKFTGTPEKVINLMSFIAEEVREVLASLGLRSLRGGGRPHRSFAPGQPRRPRPRRSRPQPAPGPDRPRQARRASAIEWPQRGAGHAGRADGQGRAAACSRTARRCSSPTMSATCTARSAPASRPRSPAATAWTSSRPATSPCGCAARPASRWARSPCRACGSRSLATPTTMSARACRAAPSSSARCLRAPIVWSENAIIGNTCLYGATAGQLFAAGRAGERFAVRNSGAITVVEGCGDNGCEYMTGGVAVILGPVGDNFAAGMSGGMAYV